MKVLCLSQHDNFDEPLNAILDQEGWPGVVEVVAEEGDVVLAHPLLFHSSNPNHGTRPRVMAQPAFNMTEPKRTQDTIYTPSRSLWFAPEHELHP